MTAIPSPEATRMRRAISSFLDACAANQMAFDPQSGYATQGEAEMAAREFWERYCELHRAVGREPPQAMNIPGGAA